MAGNALPIPTAHAKSPILSVAEYNVKAEAKNKFFSRFAHGVRKKEMGPEARERLRMISKFRANERSAFFKRHLGPLEEFGKDLAAEYRKEWNRLGPKGRVAFTVGASLIGVMLMWAHMQNQALNTRIDAQMKRIDANAAQGEK